MRQGAHGGIGKVRAHAPLRAAVKAPLRLCAARPRRLRSGYVPRLELEAWLYRDCGGLLRSVAAATVLELLATNTHGQSAPPSGQYPGPCLRPPCRLPGAWHLVGVRFAHVTPAAGKTGKHVLYEPFMSQLEAAVGNASPVVRPEAGAGKSLPRRLAEGRLARRAWMGWEGLTAVGCFGRGGAGKGVFPCAQELSPRRVQSPRRVVEVRLVDGEAAGGEPGGRGDPPEDEGEETEVRAANEDAGVRLRHCCRP